MSHAGLDNLFRLRIPDQTPCRPYQPGMAIIPPLKAFRAGPNPFRFQFIYHFGP